MGKPFQTPPGPALDEPVLRTARGLSRDKFHAVAYTEWGGGNRETVVCLHGLTRQGRDFDYLARALASAGYRVVCPDIVGRGRSDWLSYNKDYDVEQYVVDMAVLVAGLGVERVHWVGTSLGGLVGLLLAGRSGSPVASLVLNDIGPHIESSAALRIASYIKRAPASFPSLRAVEAYLRDVLRPFGDLSDDQWLHMAVHSSRRRPDGSYVLHYDPGIAGGFRSPTSYERMFWRAWEKVACPVLVLRGVTSDLLLPRTVDRMVRTNPNARAIEFNECGHAPALASEEQIGVVLDWVSEVLAPERGREDRETSG